MESFDRRHPMSKRRSAPRTLAFNKPYDVLPSFTDPEGRPTLGDYIDVPGVYAAGRLDRDSEGLLLLTSDGLLAHRITDPRHHFHKVYLVQVERIPDEAVLERGQVGFVIREDGLILTIGYLITEAQSIWLTTNSGTRSSSSGYGLPP